MGGLAVVIAALVDSIRIGAAALGFVQGSRGAASAALGMEREAEREGESAKRVRDGHSERGDRSSVRSHAHQAANGLVGRCSLRVNRGHCTRARSWFNGPRGGSGGCLLLEWAVAWGEVAEGRGR